MSKIWESLWESRRIREQIAHQYEKNSIKKLKKDLEKAKKDLYPLFRAAALNVVETFVPMVDVSIICGRHWKDIKEEPYAYAQSKTFIGYKAKIIWAADDMTEEDYLAVHVWFKYPHLFSSPHFKISKLCQLFNHMPTVHAYSGSLFTMGELNGVFCHFNFYFQEPEIPAFDFLDFIQLPVRSEV